MMVSQFVWSFPCPPAPIPRPMSLELVRGEKVAFAHETANTAGCQLYRGAGDSGLLHYVQEVRRGRVRVVLPICLIRRST